MVDRDDVVELAVHYLAMLLLMFVALYVLRATASGLNFWLEFVVLVIVVSFYRPVVERLGVSPNAWQRDDDPDEE